MDRQKSLNQYTYETVANKKEKDKRSTHNTTPNPTKTRVILGAPEGLSTPALEEKPCLEATGIEIDLLSRQ